MTLGWVRVVGPEQARLTLLLVRYPRCVMFVAQFLWGVIWALAVWLAVLGVRRIRRHLGRVAATLVGLLSVCLFLLAMDVPRAIGMTSATGWAGVALFGAGLLCVEIPLIRHQRAEFAAQRWARAEAAEVVAGTDFFITPEEAALSGWDSAAQAYVVSTRFLGDSIAEVLVDTAPSHPVVVRCERFRPGWVWTESEVSA